MTRFNAKGMGQGAEGMGREGMGERRCKERRRLFVWEWESGCADLPVRGRARDKFRSGS